MTALTKRLIIMTAVLVLGFSSFWIMPRSGERKLSRLSENLPEEFNGWVGEKREISEVELKTLAEDTVFARKGYSKPGMPGVETSVVFSGRDINNSIHRPERCLQAQGWNFVRVRKVVLKGVMPDGGDLPVKEIVCQRPSIHHETRKPIILENGKQRVDWRIQYYTFFGHKTIVEGHYGRTFADMRDRLIGGFDQQWAYATFSTTIWAAYAEQGIPLPEHYLDYDVEGCEQYLEDFIREILPHVLDKEK